MRYMFSSGRILACLALLLCAAGCSTPSHSVNTYRMGDTVQLGKLVYNVYESRWLTHLGEGTAARIPRDRFFLVRMSISNAGSEEILVPAVTATDESGHTCRELENGESVPEWLGLLRPVRPGESLQGIVVFDCAPRNYKLRLADESEQRTALVDIPLTFGAEIPELPAPEFPEKK